MSRDVSVTLRMSEELKTALQGLALEDRRTLSAYIEKVLEDHVGVALQQRIPLKTMRDVRASPRWRRRLKVTAGFADEELWTKIGDQHDPIKAAYRGSGRD